MKLLPQLEVLSVIIAQVSVLFIYAYEGCTVRFGRKGCYHRVLEGVLVTCDGFGKEQQIPTNVPQDTVYLSLVNFKLGTLGKIDFEMFESVECLTIVNSGINKIEPDAFSAMTLLMELSLESTNIDSSSLRFVNHESFHPILLTVKDSPKVNSLSFQATKNLNDLKTLNFAGNNIKEINREIFEELKSLEMLDLSGNALDHLDWDFLNKIELLNKLFLDNNRFQTIPVSMYGVFFAVKELTLSGNRFHCNCKLKWLREFYDVIFDKDIDIEAIECVSPRVRRFNDMEKEDFDCIQPHTPDVKWRQLDVKRYELNCTSYGDPSPSLTLTLPDGRRVITPPSDDLSVLHPLTPQIVSQPGKVTCEARNTEGYHINTEELPIPAVQSGVARITVMNYISLYIISALLSLCITVL